MIMTYKTLTISALTAIASIMMFFVATTHLDSQPPWLLPIALFLVATSNLIDRKVLNNKDPKQNWKSGTILLLLIFLVFCFVNVYADQLHAVRGTFPFKFALAIVLFTAWVYDFRKRVKKNVQ
jgi:cellobiose-specific phosphotransferase system component IIC